MDKRMPSFYMSFAMTIMCLGTLFNLLFVTVLGASFTPFSIGEWFALHGLAMAMIIFISEPFKCIWHYDFGWKQPQKQSEIDKRKQSASDKDKETSSDKQGTEQSGDQ
ncbi:hypothetical protein V1264_008115 [Littorina saxatilis]|uniref:Uncharacterized protein n=2 Tax=Littorina saxatilis TaxID=31220 RepID=A0AAN9ASK4_9CAEN